MRDTIVLYPAPEMGHVISMVELAKRILKRYHNHFSITVLMISADLSNISAVVSYINHVAQTYPLISFLRLPPVQVDTSPTRSRAAVAFDRIRRNAPNVAQSLEQISTTSKIAAFVIDLFCTSALSIGQNLKIPTYYFFTSGAACLAAFLYLPKIHEQYTQSFKDLPDEFLQFPGIPPLKAIHMVEPMLDRADSAYFDFVYFCAQLSKADGIIANTFDALEPKAVKTIADGSCAFDGQNTPPTYYIGPLIAAGESELAKHDCLSWLDKQPSKSVVFLCFGSRGSFHPEQVEEIANGLERSGQRFLWVLKCPPREAERKQMEDLLDFELDAVLPQGFLERVQDRGMVVKSWAPQVAVLNHESVSGFVTHCGWNSVLEAVVAGVAMVAWPIYAEQHLNRNVLVEDKEMAIPVEQRDDNGFVSGDEVEKRVRELMESERGRKLKERSWEMREKSMAALGESGSSTRALINLVETLRKERMTI